MVLRHKISRSHTKNLLTTVASALVLLALPATSVSAAVVPNAANCTSTSIQAVGPNHNASLDPITNIETTGSIRCNLYAWMPTVSGQSGTVGVYVTFYPSSGGQTFGSIKSLTAGSSTHVLMATDVLPGTRVSFAMIEFGGAVNPFHCGESGGPTCRLTIEW